MPVVVLNTPVVKPTAGAAQTGSPLARASEVAPGADEILAEELRTAAYALGRLLGKVDVEDILAKIFNDFCIGK